MSENAQNADNQVMDAFAIFGKTADQVAESIKEPESEGGERIEFFELDPAKSPDKTDSAILRLLPNFKGGKDLVRKISYKVNAPGGSKFMFDSNKSNAWSSEYPCLIADAYRGVKDDANKLAEFKKAFNYKKQAFALVQVLEYERRPELVGKIMPLRVHGAVEELIQNTLEPSDEAMKFQGAKPTNVFEVFTAPSLYLKAGIKSYGDGGTGRDFSASMFIPNEDMKYFLAKDAEGNNTQKISLSGEEVAPYLSKQFTPEITSKLQQVIATVADAPSQEDQAFTMPSDERKAIVQDMLNTINAGGTIATAAATTPAAQTTESAPAATPGTTAGTVAPAATTEAPQAQATIDATAQPSAADILAQAGIANTGGQA